LKDHSHFLVKLNSALLVAINRLIHSVWIKQAPCFLLKKKDSIKMEYFFTDTLYTQFLLAFWAPNQNIKICPSTHLVFRFQYPTNCDFVIRCVWSL